MSIVKVKATLVPGPLTRMEKNLTKTPKRYESAFAKNAKPVISKFNVKVQTVPSRLPILPFVWSKVKAAQDRARRWWFAAIGGRIPGVRIETQGGRYKRQSDTIDAGASIDESTGDAIIEIPGNTGFGLHTVGPRQVPSHKRTPWPRIDKEAEQLEDDLIGVAADTWFEVGEKVGD